MAFVMEDMLYQLDNFSESFVRSKTESQCLDDIHWTRKVINSIPIIQLSVE
jgi:hypothetical protein